MGCCCSSQGNQTVPKMEKQETPRIKKPTSAIPQSQIIDVVEPEEEAVADLPEPDFKIPNIPYPEDTPRVRLGDSKVIEYLKFDEDR